MPKSKGPRDQQRFDEEHSGKKIIDIVGRKRLNFEGSLKIESYNNVENISLKKLKIVDLEISKCSQLNIINLSELSKLTSLYVRSCPNLTTLNCLSTEKLTSLIISSCSQLANITNLSKLSKLESLSVIDCRKLTKLDYSTNGLTKLEISGCKQLKSITSLSKAPKLTSLSIIYCSGINKLDCSSSKELVELEVSDLIELNCSNTSIKTLSVNLCPGIQTLNCSNNDKLINLDISNCSELGFLDCSSCSNSGFTNLDINNCKFLLEEYEKNGIKSQIFKYPPGLKIVEKRITNNLIIVGRTGGGKSTLSNVLTDTDEFKESESSISMTKNFQKRGFEWNGKSFNVVDTIGVGDTKLSTKKVLYKVLDGIFSIPEGISQILFVIDGRFTTEEVNIFNLLKGSIFDIFEIGILDYVTIVRTKFSNFKNKKECDKDREQLQAENEIVAKIVRSCKDIVYVDNPPTNIEIVDEEEDKETVETNRKIRGRSRKIILDYLDKACQHDRFKLKTWEEIRKPIAEYLESNCEDIPSELEKNQEIQTLIKISERFCSIT